MLNLYRRLYWWLDSGRTHDQIAISGPPRGVNPELDRLRDELERGDQRRERRLRRFRLL